MKQTLKRKPKPKLTRKGIGDSKGKGGLRNAEPASPFQPSTSPSAPAVLTGKAEPPTVQAVPDAILSAQLKPRAIELPNTPQTKQPAAPNDGALRIIGCPGETEQDVAARIALHPAMQNMFIAKVFTEGKLNTEKGSKLTGELDITACAEQAVQKLEALGRNDLTEAKQMLMGQASALQAIFMEMSRRAALNMKDYLEPTDTYLRLALKAQAQCRATIETLAEIVNPRPVFINPGQVNHANGPQQVNNGTAAREPESENPPNKILEDK